MNVARRAAAVSVAASAVAGGFYRIFLSPYSQAFGPYAWRGRGSERVVAITFDDGPNEPYRSQIADILSSRGVRATFFQVGWCVERSPATTAALAAAGHVIGNHSLSHRFRTYLQPGAFTAEIERTQQILKQALGK
jgi:peptidoglycan/xylan/chitin deacetylase (PgdA/CDA1 family)